VAEIAKSQYGERGQLWVVVSKALRQVVNAPIQTPRHVCISAAGSFKIVLFPYYIKSPV
jgi:hypothetical protein